MNDLDSRDRWSCGGASAIGAGHIRRKSPNQDAALWQPRSGSEEYFLVAVADGHGGAAYVRAEVGAKLALQAAEDTLAWFFDEPESVANLPQDLVTIWQRLVREHLAANPLDDFNNELTPYGTTLVCAAANRNHCLVLQIGDGDLLLGYPDGGIERPLGKDEELVGEQTYSLCMDNASRYVRVQLLDRKKAARWPDFALVATDGVSKSFVDDTAFEQVVLRYRDLVQTKEDLKATLTALPDWLRDVSDNGSGDDATLCIATRWRMSR